MWAQVVLTPAESKALIAKAVARMDVVRQALDEGTLVIHPSSSTFFLVKEITGKEPDTEHWVLGAVLAQGLCRAAGREGKHYRIGAHLDQIEKMKDLMAAFPFKWVIEGGEFTSGVPLGEILDGLGPNDVYVKGCNALDTKGRAGVLFGHAGGGTIGYVQAAQRKKGFAMVLPVGLEKLIPVSIPQAAKAARRTAFEYGMGMPCGLIPVKGTIVTELTAIRMLSGARAVPNASGGLGGAEGGLVLAIEGEREQVTKAVEYVEQSKGAKLPRAHAVDCEHCTVPDCRFPVGQKHWASQ
ncbi:MAG: hypothetical protein HY900_05610 [Deltaproteobacteria bacterium]|nr:hypothetical protein [Deltaproteobacteria bacterium]